MLIFDWYSVHYSCFSTPNEKDQIRLFLPAQLELLDILFCLPVLSVDQP